MASAIAVAIHLRSVGLFALVIITPSFLAVASLFGKPAAWLTGAVVVLRWPGLRGVGKTGCCWFHYTVWPSTFARKNAKKAPVFQKKAKKHWKMQRFSRFFLRFRPRRKAMCYPFVTLCSLFALPFLPKTAGNSFLYKERQTGYNEKRTIFSAMSGLRPLPGRGTSPRKGHV